VPTPIAHRGGADDNQCYACHVLLVNERQRSVAVTWKESVHAAGGVICADCHGGDASSDKITVAMSREAGFIGVPSRRVTVGICGGCHSDADRMRPYGISTDQYSEYWTSVHGQRLLANDDGQVAICVDCHGSHSIKKASDPTADVYPLNVPAMCSRCHSDPQRMEPYDVPSNQYAVYENSVHGKTLLGKKDTRAPSCSSCHGSHSAQPPRSANVVDVCGKCHTATQKLYLESRHADLERAAPKCWTCHGTHDVQQAGEFMFFHDQPPEYVCSTCHSPPEMTLVLDIERFQNPADRRCDTCHHPESFIYSQVESIAGALSRASVAQSDADETLGDAKRLGMLVPGADVGLTEAKTAYIQAQAAVHTTKLTAVTVHTDQAIAKAESVSALAQDKIDESVFRRQAMVVVIALILINVVILYVFKRQIDRRQHQHPDTEPPP
jgi:hypothetical protein